MGTAGQDFTDLIKNRGGDIAMAELKLIKMSQIQSKPVEWLWEPYIPIGAVSLIQGDGGLGKTTISLSIAAAVSTGVVLPGGISTSPAAVIVLNAEDSYEETIRPRLDQLGADNDMITVIDDDDEPLTFTDSRIEEAIIRTNARLVICDPTQAFFGRANMNAAGSVRPIMKHLGKIAQRHRLAILLVGHLGKQGSKAAYRGLGSVDIFAAARSVLTVECVTIVETGEKINVMAHNKSNLAPHGPSLSFEIDPVSGFRWTGECDITIDELFEGETEPGKAESQLDKAMRIIRTALASGTSEAAAFEDLAVKHSISMKTFQRAKAKLDVRSVKFGDTWHWELPIEGEYTEVTQEGQHGQVAPQRSADAIKGSGFCEAKVMNVMHHNHDTQNGQCKSLSILSALSVLPDSEGMSKIIGAVV
jgi:archaellum biogenesis ATPase FlaH